MRETVTCQICGVEVRRITTSGHLQKHGITFEVYKERFPNAETMSEATAAKVGDRHRGKVVSIDTRAKQSEAKLGEKHPYYGKKRPEHAQLMRDHNPMMDPEKRAHHLEWAQSVTNRQRVGVQVDTKTGQSLGSIGGTTAALLGVSGPKCYLKGHYLSTKTGKSERFASSYELVRFVQLDSDITVTNWTKIHSVRVKFIDPNLGKLQYHLPDIEVKLDNGKIRIEEVKGWCSDVDATKIRYARDWCEERGWEYVVLTQAEVGLNSEKLKELLDRLILEKRLKLDKTDTSQ